MGSKSSSKEQRDAFEFQRTMKSKLSFRESS